MKQSIDLQQVETINATFYSTTACLIKASVLCLYRRIFDTPLFRLISLIVMGLCICWAIGIGFAQFLRCNPLHKAWDPEAKGHCYPYGRFIVSGLVLELVLDTVILSLPLPMVSRLQMSRAKRLSVSLIFLLGGL